jgi:hypothetical protein
LPGEQSQVPALVSGANELQIVYEGMVADGNWAMFWRRLSPTGNALSPPVLIGGLPRYLNPSPAVAIGADTVILAGGHTGGVGIASALGIARITGDGSLGTAVYEIARARPTTWYDIARRGPDVVVVWLRGDFPNTGIGIARVTP